MIVGESKHGNGLIEVRIFGANLKLCDADCGPSLSEEELAESVRLGFGERFGDRVKVYYHSLRDPATIKEYGDLLAQGRELGVPLPVVAIDGSILMGGGIDYRAILNAVELKLEVES